MSLPQHVAASSDEAFADHLVDTLATCAREVFDTMVGLPLTEKRPLAGDALRPASNMVGTVGFTGSSSGLVVFYTTFDAARMITASLLGMDDPADAERDEVVDAIGEITNMIAGSFRTRLAIQGDAWAISVPTVTLGSDFYIKPVTTGRRTLLSFGLAEHEVLVELILTGRVGRRDRH